MPAFIALLRGVNVGKGKRVPMAHLRIMLGKLGYSGISTLLNSGNAVFISPARSASAHAARIRDVIQVELAIDVPVVVKSAKELDAIVKENTLAVANVDPSRLLVICGPNTTALSSIGALQKLVVKPERFLLARNAAYLLCANGILESAAAKALLGKTGQAITTRNWATILKLHAMTTVIAEER